MIVEDKPVNEISQEQPEILQPKRKGYSLFTITSNVKTNNGKFNVTKIIEEKNEKMAQILYKKTVEKELGKAKSITKSSIRAYSIGDVECIEEIVEKVAPAVVKELTLQERALDILCTSPYVHLFKVSGTPNQQAIYLVGENKQEIIDIVEEHRQEARQEVQTMFMDTKQVDEEVYNKLIKRIKKMSGEEIKRDKSAIKSVYNRTDESLENIIKDHEKAVYKIEHKEEIVTANFEKAAKDGSLQLYSVFIEGYREGTETLIVADDDNVAKAIALCNEQMAEYLEKNLEDKDEHFSPQLGTYQYVTLEGIENGMELFLSRDNLCTQAFCDPELTMEKYKKVLKTIDKVHHMTKEQKKKALDKILEFKKAVNIETIISDVTNNKLERRFPWTKI